MNSAASSAVNLGKGREWETMAKDQDGKSFCKQVQLSPIFSDTRRRQWSRKWEKKFFPSAAHHRKDPGALLIFVEEIFENLSPMLSKTWSHWPDPGSVRSHRFE
jgi:hypothetical protein